jgi:hypothetical protein
VEISRPIGAPFPVAAHVHPARREWSVRLNEKDSVMVFPPAAAVTVRFDGRPLRAYHAAYASAGHVYAPLRPFVTAIADRLWYEGDTLVIARAGRFARIRLRPRTPDALDRVYVPLAPVLRALGAGVQYESHTLNIDVRSEPVGKLAPFDAALPSSAPRAVFTPSPVPTPRPVWSGAPLPRRTPIPIVEPTPRAR